MTKQNTKNMIESIRHGNINTFQKEFTSQMKENIGKGLELKKTQIAESMFNKTK